MPDFTLSKVPLAHSLRAAALSAALLATQAHGQMLSGSPGQLRPSGGSVPILGTGELPTTDFGRQLLNTEHPMPVTLGFRTLPASKSTGLFGDTSGIPAPRMPNIPNLGKAPDAPPSIRVTGSQAGDFLVTPEQCKFVIAGTAVDPHKLAFSCPVTFRASAEGARSALLEALFPNGDRLQAVVKGFGQAGTVAMPAPGGMRGTGLQAQAGNKPQLKP